MPNQPVVVFDTNVLIPLIIQVSHSTRLFLRLQAAGWRIAVSPQLMAETRTKMKTKRSVRQWLKMTDQQIDDFLDAALPLMTLEVKGVRQAHGAVPADPKDDMVVAAALEANASYLISEDKHLLDLGQYQSIQIMNREQFEAELDGLGVPK